MCFTATSVKPRQCAGARHVLLLVREKGVAMSLSPEFGKRCNKIKYLLIVCPTQIAVFQVDMILRE